MDELVLPQLRKKTEAAVPIEHGGDGLDCAAVRGFMRRVDWFAEFAASDETDPVLKNSKQLTPTNGKHLRHSRGAFAMEHFACGATGKAVATKVDVRVEHQGNA